MAEGHDPEKLLNQYLTIARDVEYSRLTACEFSSSEFQVFQFDVLTWCAISLPIVVVATIVIYDFSKCIPNKGKPEPINRHSRLVVTFDREVCRIIPDNSCGMS